MIGKLVRQTILWIGGLGAFLFAVAGTLHWCGAWIFLATMGILGLGGGLWFIKHNPELVTERMKPLMQEGQPAADRKIIMAMGPIALAWFVIMALDAGRYHLSDIPPWIQGVGFVLVLLSIASGFWVMHENTFAATVVRVQHEREHHVVTTGPYAIVRHPMYAGLLPLAVGTPLLLGSWWGLVFAPIIMALFGLRTVIEERTLRAELNGYTAYAERVHYRLIPGIW